MLAAVLAFTAPFVAAPNNAAVFPNQVRRFRSYEILLSVPRFPSVFPFVIDH